jgi:exopolyphosphatase/guanosine-5'-triphosphate,3'-diphosphate pyrophosphatase
MRRKASIDIGTNSTRMLVAEVSAQKELNPLIIEERITRLGQGVQKNGSLSADAMNRVLDTLAEYMQIASSMSASITDVIATSATRDATNKHKFLQTIKTNTGLDCKVLSGDEEATYTLSGVLGAFQDKSNLLVCDIGGGSTEFIAAVNGKQTNNISLNIGSRRLTEQFLHHDPVKRIETAALRKYLVLVLINELSDSIQIVLMLSSLVH